jgi:hypothetical protein
MKVALLIVLSFGYQFALNQIPSPWKHGAMVIDCVGTFVALRRRGTFEDA